MFQAENGLKGIIEESHKCKVMHLKLLIKYILGNLSCNSQPVT